MREVHDFIADVIRRGQEQGVIAADRDADAEAWIFLAGGMLGMVGRRVGVLDDRGADGRPRALVSRGFAPDHGRNIGLPRTASRS